MLAQIFDHGRNDCVAAIRSDRFIHRDGKKRTHVVAAGKPDIQANLQFGDMLASSLSAARIIAKVSWVRARTCSGARSRPGPSADRTAPRAIASRGFRVSSCRTLFVPMAQLCACPSTRLTTGFRTSRLSDGFPDKRTRDGGYRLCESVDDRPGLDVAARRPFQSRLCARV